MKSNYVIILIIVLLVAVGAVLFFSAPEAQAPIEGEESEETSEILEEENIAVIHEEQEKKTPIGSNEGGAEEVPVNLSGPTQEVAGAQNPGPDTDLYEVVTYTENGFEPRVLVISAGDEVFFWNRSDDMMWVSGDVLSCDASERGTTFDSCGEIGAGNGWTYTFTDPGTYDYKDNNDWSNEGRIIVE